MSNLVVITDLKQVNNDIYEKIFNFCKFDANVVLRAKELSSDEYFKFASNVLKVCKGYEKQIFVHKFYEIAINLGVKNLWLPIDEIRHKTLDTRKFDKVVASTHNIEEANLSLKFGANTLCLSHIFKTKCKKDLNPKDVNFIKEIKAKFDCEIYALGGINKDNFKECLEAGASKICVMSSAMKCRNEKEFIDSFKTQ